MCFLFNQSKFYITFLSSRIWSCIYLIGCGIWNRTCCCTKVKHSPERKLYKQPNTKVTQMKWITQNHLKSFCNPLCAFLDFEYIKRHT